MTAEGEQRRQESLKLLYDWFKHLTTLATGTILVSAALARGLFVDPQHFWLFGLSLVLLTVSLATSTITMMFVILDIKQPYTGPGTPESSEKRDFVRTFAVTWACFLFGIGAFLMFALFNVW